MDSLNHLPNFAQGLGRYHGYALRALNAMRQAPGYQPRVEVIPDSANIAVAGIATYEHRVTVPVGSVLWAMSGSSQRAEGFRVQVVDAGTQKTLCSQPAAFGNATGQGNPSGVLDCRGWAVDIVQRLAVLPRPRIVIEPGLLKVQVTNLSSSPNALQLLLWLAVPAPGAAILEPDATLSRRAIRGQTITTGSDGQQIITGAPSVDTDNPMTRPAMNMPFTAAIVGDNIIVPGVSGFRIGIHQLSLYSAAKQSLRLLDRDVDLMGALPDYLGGYGLPYQSEPHFVLSDGHPFVIRTAAGTDDGTGPVTGFVKYRMFERWPL